ncbi:MotA/TolQ/ExbB proton channel family protein [Tabrizicola sp.]|uniref:MotA/TolQ/ExbB proton channel family protein n=1 Tax=Tabrizicola sp. TaxID=2005166 RepID=UPI001A50CA98|nr:MotA/TolQ/ExbB proton channel family protein [Tabrizicola sp.]MBL9075059.1 MotA/TolQ/ExbB proton channel family protein [Tabrizicola sp.]
MVRHFVSALFFLLAGTAMAQEGASRPAVTTEAPVLGDGGTATEAAPVLPEATEPAALAPPAAEAAPVADPEDLSVAEPEVDTDLVNLVLKAHPVVQAVMGLLTLAVAAVLTVFLFKIVEFALAFARLRRARAALAADTGLVALAGQCPLALSSQAACDEVDGLSPGLTADLRASSSARLELALDRIEAGAVMRLRSGTGLLASIGAVGPFVGLFGTVFGIMNSFLAIAATKTTSLAVVAPGIAEALLATGIGLVAAVPAVLLYNAVMRRIGAYRHTLADGRAELLARFSREMDRRMGV